MKGFMKTRRIPARYVNQGKSVDPKKENAARKALKWEPIAAYREKAFDLIRQTKQIFYNKHLNYAHCMNCDGEFESKPEFKHGQKAVCPFCKKELPLKNINLYPKEREFHARSLAEYFQKGRSKGSFCCAYSEFTETVQLSDGKAVRFRTTMPLTVLVILPDDTRVRFEYRYVYGSKGWTHSFEKSNRLNFVYVGLNYYGPADLDANVSLDVKKSLLSDSRFAYYAEVKENMRSDHLCCMTDEVERLFKAGYKQIADTLLERIFNTGYQRRATVDVPVGRNPRQMFGLKDEYIRYFEQQKDPSLSMVEELLFLQKYHLDTSLRDSVWAWNNRLETLERLGLDVKKTLSRYGNKVVEYIDYIKAIREVDDYRKDEKAFMYPSLERLMPLHDEFMKKLEKKRKAEARKAQIEREKAARKARIEREKREKLEAKLIEEYAKMLEIFEYKADGFLIRPLKSVSDMVHESDVMRHCIKTYTDSYSQKVCSLFTIRTIENPDVPICSVEIRYKKNGWFLVQSRGKCNSDPEEEVKAFIKKWMTNVANICKQRKNQKIVKQLHAA